MSNPIENKENRIYPSPFKKRGWIRGWFFEYAYSQDGWEDYTRQGYCVHLPLSYAVVTDPEDGQILRRITIGRLMFAWAYPQNKKI